MVLKQCHSQKEWDDFILSFLHTPFHQMWSWGELEALAGEKVRRFHFFDEVDGTNLRGAAQILYHKMPGGFYYAYLPRGPVGVCDMPLLVEKIKQENNPVFLLLEPLHDISVSLRTADAPHNENPRSRVFVMGVGERSSLQRALGRLPRHTLILDLYKNKDEIKNEMHEKCRYNIGLAERKGVEVAIQAPNKNLTEDFLFLLSQTAKRDKFSIPSNEHIKMLCSLGGSVKTYLACAKYQGKIIAINLILSAGDTVTYLHGASDYENRKVMAPHILHWRTIQWAKACGAHYYDFWGMAPEGSIKEKEWAGLSRFKKGFGGEVVEYPEPRIAIFRPFLYSVYKLWTKYLTKIFV